MPYHYTTGASSAAATGLGSRSVNTFEFYRFRFHFRAARPGAFPAGQERQRGARRLRHRAARDRRSRGLRPPVRAGHGSRATAPSGLADWPRPFVFRAAHLDGLTIPAGRQLLSRRRTSSICAQPVLPHFRAAFADWPERASGPDAAAPNWSGSSNWTWTGACASVWRDPAAASPIRLDPEPAPVEPRARPLSDADGVEERRRRSGASRVPDSLRAVCATASAPCARCMAPGPLDIDFRGLGERAARGAARPLRTGLGAGQPQERPHRPGASPRRLHRRSGISRANWPNSCPGCAPPAGWAWAGRRSGAKAIALVTRWVGASSTTPREAIARQFPAP